MLHNDSPAAGSSLKADLLITNAIVRTMDADQSVAAEVAIHGNRIAAVGVAGELRGLAGPCTRIIDAGGALVLPGFNDAHVHFLMGGFSLGQVDLRGARSPEEFTELLRVHAAKVPDGQWILGGEWDHERWPGAPLPTREWVDAAAGEHPVLLSRLDGHMAIANTRALTLAGVNRNTQDPAAGFLVRDPRTGEPTGLLKDTAMGLVEKVIPVSTFAEKLAAARAASRHAARLGVTSVQDMSTGADLGVYQQLMAEGELRTRIYGLTPLSRWERLAATGLRAPFGTDFLRIGGMKAFSDGSLGSATALFFDPYLNDPGNCGLPGPDLFPAGAARERMIGADRAGLQLVTHAIGDRANQLVLDLYREVVAANGPRDRRSRIEHAQHLRPAEIARFGPEGIIASMQPYHAVDDGCWCEARIGPELIRHTYAFRSLLDAGAVLAFGSDWTVAPLDPLTGIAAAVMRQTLDGRHPEGWLPEQRLTVAETVRAYTMGSAYAEFAEDVKGSITPGKLADLVILDRDLFTIDPATITAATVLVTIVDGRVVHEK